MIRAIASTLLVLSLAFPARAAEEVRLWHAMGGALGGVLDEFVRRFNDSQKDFVLVAEHKGSYEDTMAAALLAQRGGSGPHLVQVSELGTAHMMAARKSVRRLWEVAGNGAARIDAKAFLPAVASYFSDEQGRLLALPFNTSTPILFYNKDAFRKAKLDPERAPKTWYEMPKAMEALNEAGFECPYTTTWPSWIHIETMSTWHNRDFATKDNGLGGLDAKLIFNTHLMVRHLSLLSSWLQSNYFSYSGRRLEGEARFIRGECAMLTASSASYATLRKAAGFDFGVAQLPYYDDIPGAPHHSLIGGGGLWVLSGGKESSYRGVARFLEFLSRPEVQAEWHQRTGYVPVTRAAYEHTRKQGFYAANPGHEIAIRQLLLNNPTRESRGIRLGELPAIRAIIEEELESVWEGKAPPKLALDRAAARGDALLRQFEAANRTAGDSAIPQRAPRGTVAKPGGAGK